MIRPEFVTLYTKNQEKQYQSILEDGRVEHVTFRGNSFEIQVKVKGITITVNRALTETPLRAGDTVQLLINRLYVFDDVSTNIVMNKGLDTSDMFYI